MRKTTAILTILTGVVLLAGAAWGQTASTAPKAKSKKEYEALKAIDAEPNIDAKLQKIDDFLTAFADSNLKMMLLDNAVMLISNRNDYPLTMAWGQRDLDANPNSWMAMLSLASAAATNTREFDLDKDQKLADAEKWANNGLAALKTSPKPFQFPDDKWPLVKNYYESGGHQSLGLIAMLRTKYDVAVSEFQTAFDILPEPNDLLRMGEAHYKAGKFDDAIATFDKVLAMPDLNPVVKRIAENRKKDALRRKGVPVAKPAPAAAPPAPATAPPAPTTPAPAAPPPASASPAAGGPTK